jgi:hypothetical protein
MRRAVLFFALAAPPVTAQTASAPETPGIADNSFLLEEAYNQERGVVQHISTFSRPFDGDGWAYTFTQEWPVPGQKHQVSFTVPVEDAGRSAGLGDLALNYRYQALDGSRGGLAGRACSSTCR